jgi:hypothetical protein
MKGGEEVKREIIVVGKRRPEEEVDYKKLAAAVLRLPELRAIIEQPSVNGSEKKRPVVEPGDKDAA